MSKRPIAIIGAGGLGREIRNLIERNNTFYGFYDDRFQEYDYLGKIDDINENDSCVYLVAIGDPKIKAGIIERLRDRSIVFYNVIGMHTIFDQGFLKGEGIIVCDGVKTTVGCEFGAHVLLNLNVTVGHDVIIGDYSSIMPGVNISGAVNIGQKTFVGTGAVILQGINIGSSVIIGAGAVVTKNIPDNTTVIGVPARPL